MLSLGGSQAVWSADQVNIEDLMKDGIESKRHIADKQSVDSSNTGIETNVPSPSAEKQNKSSGNNFLCTNTENKMLIFAYLSKNVLFYIYQM